MAMRRFGRCFHADRHDMDIAVANTICRYQQIREGIYFFECAFQHYRFQTIIVVEMHVHCRDADIVVVMLHGNHPARKFTFVMVVDIGHSGNAMPHHLRIFPIIFQMAA